MGSGQAAQRATGFSPPADASRFLNAASLGENAQTTAKLVSPAAQAAALLLREEKERREQQIQYQIQSLGRLRAVSEAWREARIRHLERERQTVWDTFYAALEKLSC